MASGQRLGKYFVLKTGVNPNLVAEIRDAVDKPNTDVITGDPRSDLEGNDNQQWYIDSSTQTIRSRMNGFCLDLSGK